MRNTWAVCRREWMSFFVTPIGYVIVGSYALISGLVFTASLLYYSTVSQTPFSHDFKTVPKFEEWMLSPYLVFCGQLIMFIGSLVTMRLLAEERNRGTMELLLTQPLRDREIVFGKYLASLGVVAVLMLVVATHLIVVAHFVKAEPAVFVFGVVTVFLMGAAFMSLGLFVSAMTNSQVTAGALTFGLWFLSYVLGTLGKDLPQAAPVPETWPDALRQALAFLYRIFHQLVIELPLDAHAKDMAQGVVQISDIAYYLLVIAFFLFLTFRALESRKWRA